MADTEVWAHGDRLLFSREDFAAPTEGRLSADETELMQAGRK